jgi:hypothetical protein
VQACLWGFHFEEDGLAIDENIVGHYSEANKSHAWVVPKKPQDLNEIGSKVWWE